MFLHWRARRFAVGWYDVGFTAMSFITRHFVGLDHIQVVGCSICDNGVVVRCGVIYVCVIP